MSLVSSGATPRARHGSVEPRMQDLRSFICTLECGAGGASYFAVNVICIPALWPMMCIRLALRLCRGRSHRQGRYPLEAPLGKHVATYTAGRAYVDHRAKCLMKAIDVR